MIDRTIFKIVVLNWIREAHSLGELDLAAASQNAAFLHAQILANDYERNTTLVRNLVSGGMSYAEAIEAIAGRLDIDGSKLFRM